MKKRKQKTKFKSNPVKQKLLMTVAFEVQVTQE